MCVAVMLDQKLIPSSLLPAHEIKSYPIASVANYRWRTFRIAYEFTRLIFWTIGNLWRKTFSSRELGKRVTKTFESLGFLFTKMGQFIALRTDYFPADFCDELSALQNKSVGFSSRVAKAILERELGGKTESIFLEFSEAPLAAASIGQVHLARLKNGAQVVVKVQRPDAGKFFKADLRAIRFVVWCIRRIRFFDFLLLDEFLWEIGEIFVEEVDYRYELENNKRFKKVVKSHKIYVPDVFEEYCTSKVLVMEFVEGVLMVDFISENRNNPDRVREWAAENGIKTKKVAKRILFSFMRQLLEHNLFHGDLHPGNVILLKDNRVALIDLGSVGSAEKELLSKYYFTMKAMALMEYQKASDLLLRFAPQLPVVDLIKLKEEIVRELRGWEMRTHLKELPYHEKSISKAIFDIMPHLARRRISLSWSFLKIERTFGTMDASLSDLDPGIDYPKMLKKYFVERDYRNIGDALSMEGARVAFGEIRDTIGEYRLYVEPQLRLGAHRITSRIRSIDGLIKDGLKVVLHSLIAITIIVISVFFHQHYGFLSAEEYPYIADKLEQNIPNMSKAEWLVIIVLDLYLFFPLIRNIYRFRRPSFRLNQAAASGGE